MHVHLTGSNERSWCQGTHSYHAIVPLVLLRKKIRCQQSAYCPDNYVKIIKTALGKENNVVMRLEDFLHVQRLKYAVVHRHAPGFSKARQLLVDATYPEGVTIKNTYIFD